MGWNDPFATEKGGTVEKGLFSVSCTTCRAKLVVRNKEAIGAILECPKCGSMVMVSPPEGWVPDAEPSSSSDLHAKTEPPVNPAPQMPAPANGNSGIGKSGLSGSRLAANDKAAVADGSRIHAPPVVAQPKGIKRPVVAAAMADTLDGAMLSEVAADGSKTGFELTADAPKPAPAHAAFTPVDEREGAAAVVPQPSFLTGTLLGQMLVLSTSALLGLGVVLAVWAAVANRQQSALAQPNDLAKPAPLDPPPVDPGTAPKPASEQLDLRWLPDDLRMVVDLRTSRLAAQPQWQRLVAFADAWWRPNAGQLLNDLGLRPEKVHRLTWASTDLTAATAKCIVVLQLEEGLDAAKLIPSGDAVNLGGPNLIAHRLPGAAWPHPLLLVDSRTLVTGNEDLLREVAARQELHLASRSMENLLKKLSPANDFAVVVDLSAARAAAWKLPTHWLDIWPAGCQAWHQICETPVAVSIAMQTNGDRRSEMSLACAGETVADKVQTAIKELVPAILKVLPDRMAALKNSLQAGRFNGEAADQYKLLLDEFQAALNTARCDAVEGVVSLRMTWPAQGPMVAAAAGADSFAAMRADWLAAARAADESVLHALLMGILGYVKASEPPKYPDGAPGGASFAPETRLSWIATLLPYYGRVDWHRNLEFGYNWNNAHNQNVARQVLPEVVNPALGPQTTAAGFPVTQYVGVAGVGKDAGKLSVDDPHAGVFGYGRQTRPEDIADGASNTIAVLGVQDHCGPWAQGGNATVRPLAQRPYVNGPDGFGSGQPDGMLAGMADGSVRFLSKNIDPQVVEALATIHGGEAVDAASLEPRPPAPNGTIPNVNLLPGMPVDPAKPPLAAKVKPPEPRGAAMPDAATQARLDDPIRGLTLNKMPLADAVQLIAEMSTLAVSLDPDAMRELGVSLRDPVSIDAHDTTVAGALQSIAAARQMVQTVENGQVLLTSPADHRNSLRSIRFTVSDLTGGDVKAATELAALVQKLVVPETWLANGGRGTIEVTGDALKITQTQNVHYYAIIFCEKLRLARGLPTKSRLDPKQLELVSRTARAKAALGQSISINVPTPTPILRIIEQFKQPGGPDILVDRPALAVADISEKLSGKFKADKRPLGEALKQLLEPLGLAARDVDANTLQNTTQKALAARMELEFHAVGPLLAGLPPAALIDRIKGNLRGATWTEAGGSGEIYFDAPSQCLLVLQSQPMQAAIEAMLVESGK